MEVTTHAGSQHHVGRQGVIVHLTPNRHVHQREMVCRILTSLRQYHPYGICHSCFRYVCRFEPFLLHSHVMIEEK